MLSVVNQLAKKILRRFNRVLCYTSYPITGCHFPDDLRLVVGTSNPLCFDVGAHWGETIQSLQDIFFSPTIHAFEPSLANYNVLRKWHNPPQTFIHRLGFAERSGEKLFTLYEDSTLNSFLELDPEGSFIDQKKVGVESVLIRTIDDFVVEHKIDQIDLLKMDTQGFEMPILLGATKTLGSRRVKAILLEVNFCSVYQGQSSFTKLYDHLTSLGYGLVDFYGKARSEHQLSWCNALFVSSS